MRALMLWIAIAGCGRASSHALVVEPVARKAVAPPHESIYVTGKRGLLRVFLDSGKAEVVDPAPGAMLGAGGATLHKRERRFVIARDGRAVEVDGVMSDDRPVLSPDRSMFAVRAQVDDRLVAVRPEIAVVGLADRKVRRYAVDAVAAIKRWTTDGKALVIATRAGARRLELATGALADAAATDDDDAPAVTCAAKGRRLELERGKDRQRIVLYPIARTADPETIDAVEPRTLVAAPPGGGDALFGGALDHVAFTRSCDHFVFAFAGRVYVGDVATGRYAYVVAGEAPLPAP